MKGKLFLTVLVLAAPASVLAQINLPAAASIKAVQNITARNEATDSFKAGNVQAGLAQLRAGTIKGTRAVAEDVQVVSQACAIARGLAATNHPNASATALAAVSEAGKAKGKLSRSETAYLDAQIGQLYETTLGDAKIALQYYQSALALDITRKDAESGVRRIARLQALLQTKAQEAAKLRAGGK